MKKNLHPLARLRKRALLDVDEMAKLFGCSASNVRAIECGRVKLMRVYLHKLSSFFKVDKEFLEAEIEEWRLKKELEK